MVDRKAQRRGFLPFRPGSSGRGLWLALGLLLAAGSLGRARAATATPQLPAIRFTYRGGPLIQHVKVATLYWGASWKSSALPGYFDSFFRDLFAGGQFMANLAQY